MENKIYDIVIIGAGPAGLTAGIYALRNGYSVAVVEKYMIGGQMSESDTIKNYPGYESIIGFDLGQKMHNQINLLGADTIYNEVKSITIHDNNIKRVELNNSILLCKSIIIASGARARVLGLENEQKLIGSGVNYCATCDGALYRDKTVALIGGGNSAVEDAIYLSKLVKKLIIISRSDNFTAHKLEVSLLEKLSKQYNNIEIKHNTAVRVLHANNKLESIDVENLITKETTNIQVDGMFIAIGRVPETEFVKDLVDLNEYGYIVTNKKMQTSVEGIFACGDVRDNDLKQIVVATGEGAICATSVSQYLENL